MQSIYLLDTLDVDLVSVLDVRWKKNNNILINFANEIVLWQYKPYWSFKLDQLY